MLNQSTKSIDMVADLPHAGSTCSNGLSGSNNGPYSALAARHPLGIGIKQKPSRDQQESEIKQGSTKYQTLNSCKLQY